MLLISGAQIVQKCRSHITTPDTRTESSSQFRTDRPQILGATILVAWVVWSPELLHPCPWTFTSSGMWHGAPWLAFPDVPDCAAVHSDTAVGTNTFLRNVNKATNKQCVSSHKKGILDKTALVSTCLAWCHSLRSFNQKIDVEDQKLLPPHPPRPVTFWSLCVLTRRFRTTTISFTRLNSHLTDNTGCLTRQRQILNVVRRSSWTASFILVRF